MMRWLAMVVLALVGCSSEDASSSGGSGAGAAPGTGGTGAGAGASSSASGGGQGGSGGTVESGEVDPSTMESKLLMGYQGWFACPNDGSEPDRWVHWFDSQTPSGASLNVDLWPDLSELDPDELFPTEMTYADQSVAALYSAFTQKSVVRHFRWMKEYGIDGVFLQRFSSELSDPAFFALRNQVTENVRAGAEAHGRVFAIMYDISGENEATMVEDLKSDWSYLVDTLKVTESPRYLREGGKPVLAIWGLGFKDRPGTAAQAAEIIAYFKTNADPKHQVTLMGGTPTEWRTLGNDSKTEPEWAAVYRSFDVVSPWAVGRYGDEAGADNFKDTYIIPDLAEAKAVGFKYLPVVFPGFSWHNLNGGPLNQIPRKGGAFYWRGVYNAISAGSTMIYGAMFDEVDEGTAMFKLAPTAADLPTEATLLTLDADGVTLPSDWYLRLAGEATRMVRGDLALTPTVPITP